MSLDLSLVGLDTRIWWFKQRSGNEDLRSYRSGQKTVCKIESQKPKEIKANIEGDKKYQSDVDKEAQRPHSLIVRK